MVKKIKNAYPIFIWHGFFLTLTMSMIDFNTVLPSLISTLVDSKIIFGLIYSIMLGAPRIFNIIFSHIMNSYDYRKKFLITGIYLRAFSFLGMSLFTFHFAKDNPMLVIYSFFLLIFIFAISGGFAGMAYSDIIGKLVGSGERGKLYASKQFAASIAAFLGGMLVNRIFAPGNFEFPLNYTIILFIGFAGLIIASIAFWLIDEPPSINLDNDNVSLKEYIKKIPLIFKKDYKFLRFIFVENMAGFSRMILPFYIVYAEDVFHIDSSYVGRYLLYQVFGTIVSNLFWGYISKKWSSKMVVRVCVLAGGIVPLLALIITPMGADVFVVIFFLVGFLKSGRRVGFDPYLLEIAPDNRRTVYLGIRGTFNIMVVLLPFMGGVFIDSLGYIFTFILVSTVMLAAFYLLGRQKWEYQKN